MGRQPKTGYEERAADARAEWTPRPGMRLALAHQWARLDNVWRTHRTVHGLAWNGLQRGDDLEHVFDHGRDLTWLRFDAEDDRGWAPSVTVYRQAHAEDRHRVRNDGRRDRQGFDVTTWGASGLVAIPSATGRWTAGADLDRDETGSYARQYDAEGRLQATQVQGPVADGARYDRLGIYLQNQLHVGRDGPAEITSGIRFTRAHARADRVWDPATGGTLAIDRAWNALVGSLRGQVQFGADARSSFYAGVSQGFRAPNLSDLTRLDVARSGELEVPVADLDPERYVSVEAGLRLNAAPARLTLSAYHTAIQGMIVRTPTGNVLPDGMAEVTKRNAGDGYVHGVEGRLDVAVSRAWGAWAQLAWMDGRVDGYPTSAPVRKREPVSRLMPLTARLGLRWTEREGRAWVEAVGEAAEKAVRLSAADRRDTQRIPPGGTPAYGVAHLRTGIEVTPALRLTAAIENVFNADYRIHGSGVNEPGRNTVLSAEMTF